MAVGFHDAGISFFAYDPCLEERLNGDASSTAGFTAILLHFSFANWIINYPMISPFAANRHIGELGGG